MMGMMSGGMTGGEDKGGSRVDPEIINRAMGALKEMFANNDDPIQGDWKEVMKNQVIPALMKAGLTEEHLKDIYGMLNNNDGGPESYGDLLKNM